MQRNKTYNLLAALLFLLTGCQDVVQLKPDGQSRRIVVNSILEAGTDTIRLQVSLTQTISSTDWFRVANAEATLYVNGTEAGGFKADAPGWYSIHQKVLPSTTYRIKVKVPGYGTAWGETIVPSPIQDGHIDIDLQESYGTARVNIYWTDATGLRNFYWIGSAYSETPPWITPPEKDTTTLYLHNTYYSSSPLPDPFNRVIDELGDIFSSYEYLIRIEDSGLSGSQLYFPYESGSGAGKYKAFLLSTDVHYDAFLKSSILNRENSDMTEDLPLYYEPAYTYSNIHGGVGLIASYSGIEKIQNPHYEKPSDPDPTDPGTE